MSFSFCFIIFAGLLKLCCTIDFYCFHIHGYSLFIELTNFKFDLYMFALQELF